MLILHKDIHCDPSSELSHEDGSDEGPQHMISMRNKKNYPSVIFKYSLLSRVLLIVLNSSYQCHAFANCRSGEKITIRVPDMVGF